MIALSIALVACVGIVTFGALAYVTQRAAGQVAVIEAHTVQRLTEQPEPSLLERFTREDVVVTLKSGTGFRGVLFESDDRLLVLRDVQAKERESSAPVRVDGDVVVRWVDVDFVQRP